MHMCYKNGQAVQYEADAMLGTALNRPSAVQGHCTDPRNHGQMRIRTQRNTLILQERRGCSRLAFSVQIIKAGAPVGKALSRHSGVPFRISLSLVSVRIRESRINAYSHATL